MAIHPSEWYNAAQAAIGLDPAMRGSSGVANRTEPLFKKGMSFEQMSATTGIPISQIRAYAAQAHPTYGIKNAASDPNAAADNTALLESGGSGLSASDLRAAQDDLERASLKGRIQGHAGEVDAVYGSLFGDLENLLKSRDAQLESQYGDQFKTAADKYAEAIPQIETSYASIGAGDSTDNTYAKVGAKKGFEDTNATIGKNKADDKAKLGQYGNTQRAKLQADSDSARRALGQVDSTTDVSALRDMANSLDKNLSDAQITKASLGTDAQASKDLSAITADNGRYQSALDALDGIMKSSLGGDVKKAAVNAVSTSSGLTDEEKKKVQAQFGNVYAEQAAA